MLQFEEYKLKLNNAKPILDVLKDALKLEAAQKEMDELSAACEQEGFWNDVEKAQTVQRRLRTLQNKKGAYDKLCSAWDDMYTMCEMAIEENDDSIFEELQQEFKNFTENADAMRLSTLLTGEYDANDAIITFQPGAGGLEAQSWAQILFRMNSRWTERYDYKVKIMDYEGDDDGGL